MNIIETIRLPGWLNHTAKVIEHGEHHMGAATIEFKLPFKIDNQERLFSTNGVAFLSIDGKSLYLYDAVVLLKINCRTRKAEYFKPPKDNFMAGVEEYENGYGFRFYGGALGKIFLSHEEALFKPGVGPLEDGLFPSAYKPKIERIIEAS